jgi:hypothetical protein
LFTLIAQIKIRVKKLFVHRMRRARPISRRNHSEIVPRRRIHLNLHRTRAVDGLPRQHQFKKSLRAPGTDSMNLRFSPIYVYVLFDYFNFNFIYYYFTILILSLKYGHNGFKIYRQNLACANRHNHMWYNDT